MSKDQQLTEVFIEQVIRETKQGQTAPYLCKDDLGNDYFVKGSRATGIGLAKEWICGRLGLILGLPIPPFAIAWVDSQFVKFGKYELYEYNFASKVVSNIQDITLTTLKHVPQNVINDLYIFDYWIQNADRTLTEHGGNPNFFFSQGNGLAYVLDHNLAFDDKFDLNTHKTLHVCHSRQEWTSLVDIDRQTYTAKFDEALEQVDVIFKEIPDDWLTIITRDKLKKDMLSILQRYKQDKFWEDII
jgi:hypothetical protein